MSDVLEQFQGVPYRLDLERCRRALAELEIEGEVAGIKGLAHATGVSVSTVSRFLAGRPTSLSVLMRTLEKLHLTFDQVARLEDDQGGEADAGTPSP